MQNPERHRGALPEPTDEQQAQSQRLAQRLSRQVAASGDFLPFEAFMQEALYAPGLGYYSAGATKFGASGDFVTAPEISPLFGAALAVQLEQITEASAPSILELGAGSGRLAVDILSAYRSSGIALERYAILEVSADLASRQRDFITANAPEFLPKVSWLSALPESITGAVIANEVLDAVPCRVAVRAASGWSEVGVRIDAALGLELVERPAGADLVQALLDALPEHAVLPAGYRAEYNPQAAALVATIATRMTQGAALFIDYGFPAHEFYHPDRHAGTLMAHYRHRAHDDLLAWPGLQDLTAHVDFTAIAHAADDADATLYGYTSQARFLVNCGILGLIDPQLSGLAAANMTAGCQRLLSEAEMGELFKVLAFGRGLDFPLIGFTGGDRLHTL